MKEFAIQRKPSKAGAESLLASAQLPTEDLRASMLEDFFYAGDDGVPEGLVGLQILGKDALLRSLAVNKSARRTGLVKRLVEHAEDHARSWGVHSLYLLTTTAESFFQRLNYVRVNRGEAPESIKQTTEFGSLCPSSSAFMMKPFEP